MEIAELPLPQRVLVAAHYALLADTIATNFAGIPITTVYLPDGLDGDAVRVSQLHKPVPAGFPTVSVTTRRGRHRYLAVSAAGILWRTHAYGVGFETWTPTATDPLAVRFARIVLTPIGLASIVLLRAATTSVLDVLAKAGIDGVLVVDGESVVIWVPFDDAPGYTPVRMWLHGIVDAAVAASPSVFESAHGEPLNRIRASVRSNAPGLGTGLPYALLARHDLPVITPIGRGELADVEPESFTIESMPRRFAMTGDVFASEVRRIGAQRFAPIAASAPEGKRSTFGPFVEFVPRAEVIQVAYQILSDGRPRSADEIIAEAARRGAWPKDKTRKYLYVMLKMYVEKTLARGRAPLIVQDPDRRFRLNHAPDDNPDPRLPYQWEVPHDLMKRLRDTASGDDPTAFEVAVCDAFAVLGFAVTHVGGTKNPDGYADAILGSLGYRFMIECKTSSKAMQRPDIFEAGKYKDQFGAQFAIIIAPAFGDDKVIADECTTHGVSAWSVDDLCRLLELGASAIEIQPMLAPGIAENARVELQWNREHGAAKRAAVVCDGLLSAGWAAQQAAVTFHAPTEAPLLTEDAGMMLVDEYLRAAGSHTPCTRPEIREAFAYLTHPRVGCAAWTDATRTAIVVTSGVDRRATTSKAE